MRRVVQTLLQATGVDLTSGAGIPELIRFQEHFSDYKITVYLGLSCYDIMFEGQVDDSKRINLIYDDDEIHYHVITKLTGAMAKKYDCKVSNKSYFSKITHVCDQTCSDCMTSTPCTFSDVRSPATNVTDILEFGHVSVTTSRARQRENPYVNVNGVARRVDCS